MTVWFDIDDLIRYFQNSHRPTGIQRFNLELYRSLWRIGADAGTVRYCRRTTYPAGFQAVDFPWLDAAWEGVMACPIQPQAAGRIPRRNRFGGWLRTVLPTKYRGPVGRIGRALAEIAKATLELVRPVPAPAAHAAKEAGMPPPDLKFAAGDWLVNLGSSWNSPYQPGVLAGLRAEGVRFAIMIFDLIPELFPEWSAPETLREFQSWLCTSVPFADLILTPSRNTAADVAAYMRHRTLPAPPVIVLPLGAVPLAHPARTCPVATPFILLVSTIEIRKNHAMMFRVWQKLLQAMPATHVPDLVFAGKIGWLTSDLLQQIENTNWLGGKIKFVESPDDAHLAALYHGCLFTVFPSLYEGWGLPISESLAFGKTCAASNRASIPDAGGHFCTYFDPENIDDAAETIRGLIEHPDRVAALEARIAREFQPASWGQSAAALMAALAGDIAPPLAAPELIGLAA